MKRSYITNLLLLTLIMVLLWQLDRLNTPATITTMGKNLTASMVQTITIERAQQNPIEITRNQYGWQLERPFVANASNSRINMMLSLLDTVPSRQFAIDDSMDLSAYGLAEPALTLQFNTTSFAFGDTEQLSGQRYIRNNDDIYLVNDTLSPLLQASASGFIENRLFANSDNLKFLSLPYRAEQMLKNKTMNMQLQNGQWQSADPEFSTDALTAIAQAWQQAYAMQVSPNIESAHTDFMPLEFRFEDGELLYAYARLSAQGLSVLIPDRQLQYQFPASTAISLFPARPTNNETD